MPPMSDTATSPPARRPAAAPDAAGPPRVRQLGRVALADAYAQMRHFTAERGPHTPDEIWLLEHPPVYTLGLAGRPEHLRRDTAIPLERIDRGGQITYHGPGQLIAYVLLDLARRGLGVRQLVGLLEESVIRTLAGHGVSAARRPGAPGVYVRDAKIAALGLRVRRGCSYHGLALNVSMDLSPFESIDPCGYPGLRVTQTAALGIGEGLDALGEQLSAHLIHLVANPNFRAAP